MWAKNSNFIFLELTAIFKKEMSTVCLFVNSVFKTVMLAYYLTIFKPGNVL